MNLREHLKQQLKDADFRQEYNALEPEYEIVWQIIKARSERNLTQKELADRVGLKQSHISRLESGTYNPTLSYLKKIAKGLDKELHIEFK